MQIYSASQIHQWDQFTIEEQGITSLELMERAATACYNWLMHHGYKDRAFTLYCGKGNNGGDGLALARLLALSNHQVIVNITEFGHKGTADFQANLVRLHDTGAIIRFVSSEQHITEVPSSIIMIDAIFGSGLNRNPDGLNAALIRHINDSGCEVISIDIPSGMSADESSAQNVRVKAAHTLTFGQYKLAFMMPENEADTGSIHVLDIALSMAYHNSVRTGITLVDKNLIRKLYRPRSLHSHKGTFGHALISAGSYGKIGAAVLATRACLKSGAGLTTIHAPACGYDILQQSAPEAMMAADENLRFLTDVPADLTKFSAIAIGPGIGTEDATLFMLEKMIRTAGKPIVVDADALNMLARHPALIPALPAQSILTPHPKEFERLFGEVSNDFERMHLAVSRAKELDLVIVLKGHRTLITSKGSSVFNDTGNPGMATGGSGDALTGIITALLAQHYEPVDAAVLGVYIHGLAGDLAAASMGQESMIASDLIDHLGQAFLTISSTEKI